MNVDIANTSFIKNKNKPKWIIDINIKCKNKNLLEANTGENTDALGFRYNTKCILYENKQNLDLVEMKNFCSVKDTVKRIKRQATYW